MSPMRQVYKGRTHSSMWTDRVRVRV